MNSAACLLFLLDCSVMIQAFSDFPKQKKSSSCEV